MGYDMHIEKPEGLTPDESYYQDAESVAATRYAAYAGHPLRNIRQDVLDVAREQVQHAVISNDVDHDVADAVADAVVMSILKWLRPEAFVTLIDGGGV